MNFRFFSLVGFVCACAPFGVSSTQEVDNCEVSLSEGSIFWDIEQRANQTLANLKESTNVFQNIATSLGIDIHQQETEPSILSLEGRPIRDRSGDVLGWVVDGICSRQFKVLSESELLSNQLLQLVTRVQQSLKTSSAKS